jgi:hypothetical protein
MMITGSTLGWKILAATDKELKSDDKVVWNYKINK